MECSSGRPHVLLLPYPAQGHINPMMQLGKRLAAVGVRVTLATMQHVHSKIVRAQQALEQPMSESHMDFKLESIRDGLPLDVDRELWSEELASVIDKTLEEGALEVVHMLALQGNPVTCIVGDFFLRWTCTLARRTGLPEFIFWPQCASVFSIYFHLDSLISSGYHPFEANVRAMSSRQDSKDMVSSCIPGLPAIHLADLPFESPFGKFGLDWIQEVLRYRFCHIGEAQGLIINSFQALEKMVCEALQCEIQHQKNNEDLDHHIQSLRFLGPLVPLPFLSKEEQMMVGGKSMEYSMSGASLWEEEVEECMQWLDGQPVASVVLVAFGSLKPISVDQLQELAAGLVASGQRFLWVIRKDSIKPAKLEESIESARFGSVDVELEEALPHGFLEENKDICKVVHWAPQALVLSHSSVGAFFSHCGWNSTLDSICAGVPILGWPWLTDQVTDCWLVSHVWNMGLTLPRNLDNHASKDDIATSLKQLMHGPLALDMRAHAKELSKLARDALLQSPYLFQSFVDDIKRCPPTISHGNGKTY